jgi:hypothetical protein
MSVNTKRRNVGGGIDAGTGVGPGAEMPVKRIALRSSIPCSSRLC